MTVGGGFCRVPENPEVPNPAHTGEEQKAMREIRERFPDLFVQIDSICEEKKIDLSDFYLSEHEDFSGDEEHCSLGGASYCFTFHREVWETQNMPEDASWNLECCLEVFFDADRALMEFTFSDGDGSLIYDKVRGKEGEWEVSDQMEDWLDWRREYESEMWDGVVEE